MSTTIDELIVALGFEYDPEGLDEFNQALDDTKGLIKSFAKVVAAGTAAIVAFTIATTEATDVQGKMAEQMGISVGELDAWQHAATIAGESSESMSSSLENLAIRASEASRGIGSGVEAFGILGLQVADANGKLKSAPQLLLDISSKLQGFSKIQQIELADKLGLRDTIRLLQQGPSAIEALVADAKLLGVITDEDAAISAKFQDNLVDLWRIIKSISRTITRFTAPALGELADYVTDWWKANRKIIEQRMPEWIDKATKAIKLLSIASAIFIALKLVDTVFKLAKAFRSLSISAALAQLSIVGLPALIVLGLAAILLLAEDSNAALKDNDSIIGDLMERYPEWRKEIALTATVFSGLWDVLGLIKERITQTFSRDYTSRLDSWEKKTQEFIDLYPEWADEIRIVSDLLDSIADTPAMIVTGWKLLFDELIIGLRMIGDGYLALIELIKENSISDILKGIPGFILEKIGINVNETGESDGGAISGLIGSGVENLGNFLIPESEQSTEPGDFSITTPAGFFQMLTSSIVSGIKAFGTTLSNLDLENFNPENSYVFANGMNMQPAANPVVAQSTTTNTSNASSKSISIGDVNIKVEAAVSPERTAEEVGKKFEDILQQASQDVSSGVDL